LLKTGDPEGSYYMPAMSDAPLRGYGGHDWFWEPGREQIIYPLENLVEMYYNSVGHNTTLILGVTPNPEGLIPEADATRLTEFGKEIERRFLNPIASTSGKGEIINLELPEMQTVNQLVIMEDIAYGERVREFILEGKNSDGWQEIFKGSCIGHKFIHRFDALAVTELRLKISESADTPQIKGFTVYNIEK
jgi:alpha-L-fucosidase